MPAYNANQVVYGKAWLSTVITALGTRPAGALIVTPKVRLSQKVGFNPLSSNVIADFTPDEATFVGYSAGGYTPTFSAQVNLSVNTIGIVANVVPICTSASAPSPNTCTGFWMDDGTNVVLAAAFAAPFAAVFANPGDYLDLQVNVLLQLLQAA